MNRLTYIVTYLPVDRSEPVQENFAVRTGNPDIDVEDIIDDLEIREGAEVLHIRWSNGGTVYAAPGIDR